MPGTAKMLQRHFLALILRKICFYNFEVTFGLNGVKIDESVYFCMRIKKVFTLFCFLPSKIALFILAFSRSRDDFLGFDLALHHP